ncbi:DUF6959 family protein [Streptomyces sp. BI20]|uniref:DUF6959 family protein n=1 Tax=Streptomyces sp. BI20 TaxID=3403460 RepID=UPI003C73CD2F
MSQEEVRAGRILEIFGNYSVIQVPGRNHPAVAIQGDSLKILQETVRELSDCLAVENLQEARFPLQEIIDTLAEMISVYESAARRSGFDLPYHP